MARRLVPGLLLPDLASFELLDRELVTEGSAEATVARCSRGDNGHPDQGESKVDPGKSDQGLCRCCMSASDGAGTLCDSPHLDDTDAVACVAARPRRAVVGTVADDSEDDGNAWELRKQFNESPVARSDSTIKLTKVESEEYRLHGQHIGHAVDLAAPSTDNQPEVVQHAHDARDEQGSDGGRVAAKVDQVLVDVDDR